MLLNVKLHPRLILPFMHEKTGGNKDETRQKAEVLTQVRTKLKKPNLYRVLLLNDDYTPMDFVVSLLQNIFHKNKDEAIKIMLYIHHSDMAECGVYTYEVAESKVKEVLLCARAHQYPLQCIMEKK